MSLGPIRVLMLLASAAATTALAQDPGLAAEACRTLGELELRVR